MHNELANDVLVRPMSHGRRYASIGERALLLSPLIFSYFHWFSLNAVSL